MKLRDFNWKTLLPYDRGNEEAEFEQKFIDNLKVYLLSGNQPAACALLTQLEGSNKGLSLPLRIDVCRILYELLTSQKLNLTLFNVCCTTLGSLL
ncbi:hypothetical protein GGI21_004762, partial [Coemansia aciculifera]